MNNLVYGIKVPIELGLNKSSLWSDLERFLENEYNVKFYTENYKSDTIIGIAYANELEEYVELDTEKLNTFIVSQKEVFDKIFELLLNIWTNTIKEHTEQYIKEGLSESEMDIKMKALVLPDALTTNWFII